MRDILNLTTYPIDRPESDEYAALVERCRNALRADGMFELPGFIRPEVASRAADLAAPAMASKSFRHARRHNVYFLDAIDGLAADHPALTKVESVHHTLCADQIVGNPVLDLDYIEDSSADADANFVLIEGGHIAEVQATAEGATYDEEALLRLLRLARIGCDQIFAAQALAVAK